MRVHPTTIEQGSRVWFDGKYKPAAHRFARLRKGGKIAKLGLIPRDKDGRPQYQFAGWDVGNAGLHEYFLTEVWIALREGDWVRGPKVSQKRRPDAEWTCGRLVNVEMDLATESEAQWKDRMEKYRGSADPVLVVVHNAEHPDQTAKRVIRLMAWSDAVSGLAFFVSLDDLRRETWNVRLADGTGKTAPLGTVARKTAG